MTKNDQITPLPVSHFNVIIPLVLKEFFTGFCDLVYPHTCLLCKKFIQSADKKIPVCSNCQQTIIKNKPPFCGRCSRYLGSDNEQLECKECRRHTPFFDGAWCACLYNDALRKLIHLFKYGEKTSLQYFFLQRIFSFLKEYNFDIKDYEIAMPIPLHKTRMRERGFNQAQLLAQKIARELNIPLSTGNLQRIRNTKNQARLTQKERWTNIKGAFTITDSFELFDKSVLLVDDLLTTGATASEAARILKMAGAKKVGILAVAIAV